MGNVYLIAEKDSENNLYKIGCTKKENISERIKELQTGNPNELKLIAAHKTKNFYKIETMLHNRFKLKQTLNEWYELTDDEVKSFNATCRKFEGIIAALSENPFF